MQSLFKTQSDTSSWNLTLHSEVESLPLLSLFRSGPRSLFGSTWPCTMWLLDGTLLLIWRRWQDVDFGWVSAQVSRHSFWLATLWERVSGSVSPPAHQLQLTWLRDWVVWTVQLTRSSNTLSLPVVTQGCVAPSGSTLCSRFCLTYKDIKTYWTSCKGKSSCADELRMQCTALQNIEF